VPRMLSRMTHNSSFKSMPWGDCVIAYRTDGLGLSDAVGEALFRSLSDYGGNVFLMGQTPWSHDPKMASGICC
jgi:hypothetical protein